MPTESLSIVIPARNEATTLVQILSDLVDAYPHAEIIVVNDGSEDDTEEICERHGVTVVTHSYAMGNGAAVKSGARKAGGDVLVFMDADGQHDPARIVDLLDTLEQGYDMVVGARDAASQASVFRMLANFIYNRFASIMVNHRVRDLTSGFRAVKRRKFLEFLHLYPNGFSYPATCTMAFFRAGYPVQYVPVSARKRQGNSHIRLVKDGVRFLLILFKIGTLYSPLKVFFPFSFLTFLIGLSYYLYTYLTSGRFTNMSAMLFICSVIIFLIGLVSEQITMLLYQRADEN